MVITATVSGSFHRHIQEITDAVQQLTALGVSVLSPADPRIVDQVGPFLFVASDLHRSVKLVQNRHLHAIAGSHFLWLICPDGYVGQSASLEIGFAIASGTPIFCVRELADPTLREYIRVARDIEEVLKAIASEPTVRAKRDLSLLLDPRAAAEEVHREMDVMVELLTHPRGRRGAQLADRLISSCKSVTELMAVLPGNR